MRLEYVDGGSAKFWEGVQAGTSVTVRWGRIGTAGQTKDRAFADEGAAQSFLDKQVAEKKRKGYNEAGSAQVRPLESVTVDRSAQPGQASTKHAQTEHAQTEHAPTEPEPVEPAQIDEDAFVLSPGLAKQVLPRRDRGTPKRRNDPKAEGIYDGTLLKYRNGLRAVLDHSATDVELREAGQGYLAGKATPLGAAAVASALGASMGWRVNNAMPSVGAGWVARHGVTFAAAACLELAAISRSSRQGQPHLRERRPDEPLGWQWCGEQTLTKVRSALAAAEDYTAAVAAIAERRTSAAQRVVAAFLAPAEPGWVDEACAESSGQTRSTESTLLLHAVTTLEQFALIEPELSAWDLERSPRALATLVASVGPAIAPKLAGFVGQASAELARKLLGALAELPTDEAFDLLLDRLDEKYVQPVVVEAMKRYPRRATRLLALRRTPTAAALLRAHLITHPDLDVELSPAAAAAVEAARAAGERLPDAEDLPDVLTTPPWTRPRTKEQAVHVDLPAPTRSELRWAPGEHEAWSALIGRYSHKNRSESWERLVERFPTADMPHYMAVRVLLNAPEELARPLLADWRAGQSWSIEEWGKALLARFGTDAVGPLVNAAADDPTPSSPLPLAPVLDVRVAELMADFAVRLKGVRKLAVAWFARHGADAAALLVPAALGKAGKRRTAAEAGIRLVARQVGDEAVLAAVAPEAHAGIAALLARDPLTELPARLPKVGEWADPALLPQVRVLDGERALPLSATGHLLTMLALGKPGEPYAGVDMVKEICQPASLSAFAWGLFQRWQSAGYPAKDSWVLPALGALGDDDTVRALAPLIRTWPGEGGHARAVAGLDVLTDIGTDVALLNLNGIAQKVKFGGLKSRAQEKIAQLAADLGLSSEQLADRLVPDFGLAADGSMVLDYGPRKFTVGFDEQLKPFVSDVDGTPRKALPKPSAKDDPELAPAAHQRFTALKKDVKAIAADQIRRLELAMVAQRRWSAEEFAELFVAHPLLWHVVRRLVWAAYTDDGAIGFRVAEDRSYADADDETFALPEGALIGVAHPLHLGEALAAWSEVFADYEILQPFPQLGRDVHRLTDEERAGTELLGFAGREASTGRVLTLVRRGWERGTPQDGGVEPWILKPLPDGRVVVASLDPGIVVGEVMMFPDQKLQSVHIDSAHHGYYWGPNRSTETFATLDPVTESELIADLTEVFAQ